MHSPKPWTWRNEYPQHLMASDGSFVIYLGDEAYPDDPGGCGHKPEPANAVLIAAAPELYDALRDAETILDRVVLHKDFEINPDVIRDIKSALAKAESI